MKIFTLCLFLLISGCAIYPNTYDVEGIGQSELAQIDFEKLPFTAMWSNKKFQGAVTGVWDEKNNQVIEVVGLGYGTKSHSEVFLQPGKYLIQVYCASKNLRANPHIILDVKNATRYTLACKISETKEGIFGGEVADKIGVDVINVSSRDIYNN